MKKCVCILLMLAMMLSLGGCSQVNNVLYPNARVAEFYYDRIDITKEDVKKNGIYNNLLLNDALEGFVSRNAVKYAEGRELVAETENALVYNHNVITEEPLNLWLADCTYQYNFKNSAQGEYLSSYVIKSNRQNSTYYDYLRVMKVLTHKYGECTTEMYRSDDETINPVLVSGSFLKDEVLGVFNKMFEDEDLYLQSKWVLKDYELRVFFDSPNECGIVYVFD